jgi:hypothetical protein
VSSSVCECYNFICLEIENAGGVADRPVGVEEEAVEVV